MKRAILVVACLAAALAAFAFDFSGSGFVPSDESADPSSGLTLTDESGGTLSFLAEAEPDASRMQALRAIVAEVRAWKGISVSALRAVNSADRLVVVVVPKSFSVGAQELKDAMPGGLQLYYSGSTEYDFKVKSGRYVMRVRGIYTSEEDMEAAAAQAFGNPEAFALARDPAALSKRIAALEADRDRLSVALLAALSGSKSVNAAAVAKLRELKAASPRLSKTEAQKALKAAGLPLGAAEVSAVYLVYFGEN